MAYKHVLAFRNVLAGTSGPPIKKMKAGSAITTGYGTPLVKATDGYLDAAGDNATSLYGWLADVGTIDAEGDVIDVVPALPGVQALMGVTGTPTQTLTDDFVGLDLTSSKYTVGVDDTTNKAFKLEEYFTDDNSVVRAWVSIPLTISQAVIEVD